MKIIMESMAGLGQRKEKFATNDCFPFEIWFASNRSADVAMDVGHDFISFVKTDTNFFKG